MLGLLARQRLPWGRDCEAPVSHYEKYRVVVDGPNGFVSERYCDNFSCAKEFLETALWRYLKPASTRLEHLVGNSYQTLIQPKGGPR